MTFKNWPSYRYFNLVYPLPKNSPPPLPPQHWPKCLKYFVVLHNKIRRQSAWQKTCAIFWACLHCPSGIGFWPTPPTHFFLKWERIEVQKRLRRLNSGSSSSERQRFFIIFTRSISLYAVLNTVSKKMTLYFLRSAADVHCVLLRRCVCKPRVCSFAH